MFVRLDSNLDITYVSGVITEGVYFFVPKMKTVKSIKARFSVTATGKLKRNHPGRRHLLSGKTPKRKRQLAQATVADRAHQKVYSHYMGV
jgi:large subunit ribosomal protein L35